MKSVKLPAMRLYQRHNHIWYIEYARGKSRSLHTTNKLQAIKIFNKIEQETIADKVAQFQRRKLTPLGDYADEYIASRGSKAENTRRIDKETFNKLSDYLGAAMPIQAISKRQAEGFIEYMQARGLKPVTINMAIRHIKAAFKKAIEWEYIKHSPLEFVRQLSIKNSLPKALNADQVQALLSVIEDAEDKELIQAYLYTAGRRTEIARLRWQDIRLVGDTYLIELRETKTVTRMIPLADKLQAILFYRKKNIGPVFPKWYHNPQAVSKMFRAYADKAGLNNVKLHDLRHTSATFMVLSGVDIKTIKEILGHSNIATTEIYTKLAAVHLKEGINALNF